MKIDANNIQDFLSKPAPAQPSPEKTSQDENIDASLKVVFSSLIENALQSGESDPTAVQQAKQLIDSGQLDNPENIQQSAENIVDFGL